MQITRFIESFKNFLESSEEQELRYELKRADPDALLNPDLSYQVELPGAHSDKGKTVTFIYFNGKMELAPTVRGRHTTHLDMQLKKDNGPATRPHMIKKGMLLGRIGEISYYPKKSIKVVSFWNVTDEMASCIRELIAKKID